MFLLKFFMGLKSALALIPKRRGRLYVTSDSGELYADISSTQRKQIGYSRGDVDFKLDSQKDYIDEVTSNIGMEEHPLKGRLIGEYEGDGTFTWVLRIDSDGTAVIEWESPWFYNRIEECE